MEDVGAARITSTLIGNNNLEVKFMPKNDINTNKSFENTSNKQQKLANAVNSNDAKQANLNNNHNTKKEALGPNTQR